MDYKKTKQENKLIEFLYKMSGQKIILFGAASGGKRTVINLIGKGVNKRNLLFYDNNPEKWGKKILDIRVLSFEEFNKISRKTPILITSSIFYEINVQLKKLGFTNTYYFRPLLYSEHFYLKYNDDFLCLLEEIKEKCNMDSEEKYTLYSSMKAVSDLKGEVAEVGVYKGGSARILSEYKKDKELHLFDTFKGLPKEGVTKADLVKPGWLSDVNVDDVKRYLAQFPKVFIHKGFFPQTAESVKNKKFCLVHLDTDIYQGTLEGLKFFWPRMVVRGRIITHDYNNEDCPGVKKAFKDFFHNDPEMIIEIADTQALVIKTNSL